MIDTPPRDTPDDTPATAPVAPLVTEAPPPIWTRLSVVWIVPLLALAVTLGVAWNAYLDRGVLVEIDFADATGIRPGETALRFREVDVGRVESLGFTPDLAKVRVGVRVQNEVARFIDDGARFWLVRPRVSVQGISRLDTVLSGTFIEGYWDAEATGERRRFEGLDTAPVSPDPTRGTLVTLTTDDAGGLVEGAPVIYRGVAVGRLQNLRLTEGAGGVEIDAFIDSPHDRLLNDRTRFWDTSGVSVTLGASGLRLDVRSIASLVQGGVEFETFTAPGTTAANGDRFQLFKSADTARESLFGGGLADPAQFTLLFDEAVRGLTKGTKVIFRGVEAGEVTDVSIRLVRPAEGQPREARQQAIIAVSPQRLGLPPRADAATATRFMARQVAEGLRGRIAWSGLLGATMVIELLEMPDQPAAELNTAAQPWPLIPTGPTATNDLAASAQGVFARIDALPVEELMASAIRTLDGISAIAEDEETRKVPAELSGLLAELRRLADELNAAGAAEKTIAALDGVTAAASSVLTEIEGLGATLASADAAAQAVAGMKLPEIGAQIDAILADLRTMLGSEDAERLPRALADTLTEAAALLAELRAGGAVDKLNGTLAAAQDAATGVSALTERLPQITARLQSLLATAEALVAGYGERSPFNTEILNTLRELRRASASFGALARMIERNPRAFILGR